MITEDQARWFNQTFEQIVSNVEIAIRGKRDVIRLAVTCMLVDAADCRWCVAVCGRGAGTVATALS